MKNLKAKSLIVISLTSVLAAGMANAESLFSMTASQSYLAEPKSLFGSVRARGVGDVVTIVLDEAIKTSDALSYESERSSSTTDSFSGLVNKLIPGTPINNQVNNFGGKNTVKSGSTTSRDLGFQNNITVQVVQQLPNGNLMVQGKKTMVNANERVDLLVSGIVDPRFINESGFVNSKNVANLQFAVNGKGTTSRLNNEGIINRVIRYLF